MMRGMLVALVLGASPVLAEDVALVVGNGSYQNARGLRGADDLAGTAREFEAAGFRVFEGEDLEAAELRRLARDFAAAADGSGRIVVALAGHFVQSDADAWFLATDADRPDLIGVGAEGLLLSSLYEIAARAPGRGVVLLGTEDRSIRLGAGLSPGASGGPVPQGVTVVRGDAGELAGFVEDALLVPGRSVAGALEDYSDLMAEGFLSDAVAFLDAGVEAEAPAAAPVRRVDELNERAAWARALALNSVEGYEAFLRDYPQGTNANLARAALDRLQPPDPVRSARAGEEALRLGRDARRAIQRNLSLLGYNTRGIDGVFGPATRGAVGGWQRANGYEPTTFLTAEQIERIEGQAARRAAELEAEAETRRVELERQDRAYWEATGARGGEDNLRAYLRRYPDGLYAEIAQERLRPFDDERQSAAAAADRADWDRATERDTVESYRRYLEDQPRGAFRARAEDRIEELSRNRDSAAERTEQALGLNPFTRNLVESRLDALGLRPGRVDGVFDDSTRRAIRRYQTARNLPATGFLTQDTVVRLLADSILR